MKFFASVDRRVPYALLRWGGGAIVAIASFFLSLLLASLGTPSRRARRRVLLRFAFFFLFFTLFLRRLF